MKLVAILTLWVALSIPVGIIVGRILHRLGHPDQRNADPVAEGGWEGVKVSHTQPSGSIRSRNNV